MARINHLHPVQRRGGVTDFADTAIIAALATAHAAEIESHHTEAKLLETLIHRVRDAVVHGAAVQRVRVHDQRQRGALLTAMVVASLKPAVGSGEHYLRH